MQAARARTSTFVASRLLGGLAAVCLLLSACARLPYTTQVIQEDKRVVVIIQREVEHKGYTHPVSFKPDELKALLAGFSIREQKSVPLRWFSEDVPPKKIFRLDELEALAPALTEAFAKAGPDERVHFTLLAPGPNPNYDRDTTAGWLVFRDPFFHLEVEYFHTLLPVRKIDQYDYNFPLTNKAPASYLLYFEPGRFWVVDPAIGKRGVDARAFLKAAGSP